jgi:hypothetical protein
MPKRISNPYKPLALLGALLALQTQGLAQTTPALPGIGVNLSGVGDSRERPFVDVVQSHSGWTDFEGKRLTVDAQGNPLSDGRFKAFDVRTFGFWWGEQDDPDGFAPDWSGRYTLSFVGKAELSSPEKVFTLENLRFDAGTNTTTADLILKKGEGQLFIDFKGTSSGIKNLRLIRPGYAERAGQLFTDEFLKALEPFSVLRTMDWTNTNGHNPDYPAQTLWKNRHTPDFGSGVGWFDLRGVPWEQVIELGNQTGKDLWINLPVSADDDYIKNLALLFKEKLKPNLKLYLEHGNEVWNFAVPNQAQYNAAAAEADIKSGTSKLNDDGSSSPQVWGARRHALKSAQIARIFLETFGEENPRGRIRPVLAWGSWNAAGYQDMLEWTFRNGGPPRTLFYGVAGSAYYTSAAAGKTANPEAVLTAFRNSIDESRLERKAVIDIANTYLLKPLIYEGGSDSGGGEKLGVQDRVRAEKSDCMRPLTLRNVKESWFELGGDLFMQFGVGSAYGRYGSWGITDDIVNLNTSKYQAYLELLGRAVPPAKPCAVAEVKAPLLRPAGGAVALEPGSLNIAKTSSVPVLDGKVDPAWSAASAIKLEKVNNGVVSSAADLSSTLRALWDDTALYVLYEVTDDAKQGVGPYPWERDAVEIYLDGDGQKGSSYGADDFQFVFPLGKNEVWEQRGTTTGVQYAAEETANGYRLELAIPWGAIKVRPAEGLVLGFEAQINDNDNGVGREGKLSWWGQEDLAWRLPSSWGSAVLKGTR